MNVPVFHAAFERMRTENLGKQFERRELGLLALQYGIYFNSTMWACGLGSLFRVGKIGSKYVYSFKNIPISVAAVSELDNLIRVYKHDNNRTIEHAKSILRRFNIHQIDLHILCLFITMRTIKKNHLITILGKKIGNTYIKSEEGNTYPLTDTKFTKFYKNDTKYWWILKRHFFQWRVMRLFPINLYNYEKLFRITT